MYNQKKIIEIYNKISDEKINKDDLAPIISKLYLIMNKIEMDDIELVRIIDTLFKINESNEIEKITPEVVDLIIRATKNEHINLEGTLYFSIILKHVILPYNKNICEKDYNLILFLSEFEIFLDLANKMLKKKDLIILDKYNHELKEVIVNYKEARQIYDRYVLNDVMLSSMLLHFATMIYFNLDDYDEDYSLIKETLISNINNYQEFIDYCCSLDIHKNYTRINQDLTGIELEYIISYEMLKVIFEEKKGKIKRK